MPTLAIALPGIHHVRRGAETAMEALAGEIAALPGWEVTVFGLGEPAAGRRYGYEKVPCPELARYAGRPSLPMFRTPAQWQEWTFARGLKRAAAGRRWDVTLACSWPWTHLALRRLGDRHVFWTQNGDHMITRATQGSAGGEYGLFACDGLVCTNPAYYERHRARWRSVLLPNGVDPGVFRPDGDLIADCGLRIADCEDGEGRAAPESAIRNPQSAIEPSATALVVSALVPHKGVDRAVRAAAAIPGLRLVVCGEGPEGERLDRMGAELMPGRYVRVTLPRERMPALYRSADVVIHPCETEPSANVWSEALASGLPVVAHRMPVTEWVLGGHGELCDATDVGELTAAVGRAISERGDASLRAARHASARGRLAWSAIAREMAGFMEGLLPASAGGDPAEASRVGAVVIGRNEGERLVRCLSSLPAGMPVVYVDSGSTDGSRERARGLGAAVVELDGSRPFTAARGRNAGLAQLGRTKPELTHVLFLDGDTELMHGFVGEAVRAFEGGEKRVVAVAGRRRERAPSVSVYNRLCDMEWNSAVGEAKAVGGDAVYEIAAMAEAGGFDESLIAGEEPELAVRLRRAGGVLRRIPVDMTLHDAAMTRFGQWWRRHVRAGHAYAEGHHLHGGPPERFRAKELRSIVTWGGAVPLLLLAAAVWRPVLAVGAVVFVLQAARVAAGRLRRGDTAGDAVVYGAATVVAKVPQLQGVLAYHLARLRGKRRTLIEYKGAPDARPGTETVGG